MVKGTKVPTVIPTLLVQDIQGRGASIGAGGSSLGCLVVIGSGGVLESGIS